MTRHVARGALFAYLDKAIRPRYVAVTWLERESLAMDDNGPRAGTGHRARPADRLLLDERPADKDAPGLLHRVRKFAETEVLPVVNSYR